MFLTTENGAWKITASSYHLTFAVDRPFVRLSSPGGEMMAELFLLSGVHPLEKREDQLKIEPWPVGPEHFDVTGEDEIVFSLNVVSSAWKRKTVRLRCRETGIRCEVEVEGKGRLVEVTYFGGYYSGNVRWGSGFFWSGQRFKKGFNPEPNTEEHSIFTPAANSVIDLMGVPLPGKSDWFFTPPPFCFAFESHKHWLGMGVEAEPGQNLFTEYQYHGKDAAFFLSLSFEGYPEVNGTYTLPAVQLYFVDGHYEALQAHVQSLQERGFVPATGDRQAADWWYEPLFCGWGAQFHLARVAQGHAPDFATQANYEAFMETLSANKIDPGTVVIDDKWQQAYGENNVDRRKWPDLAGFIDRQHQAGRKVLLWLKAWDPEGIPPEECIRNAAGMPVAVDPTNPDFAARLRTSVRRMIGEYGADGFKIDFSARIPSGPGMQVYGRAWGLELMRLYFKLIHDEAKAIKPDAFIITHTPNPYLADLVDAIRLNDINPSHDICKVMGHRATIAQTACPQALIDTDNWPISDKATWREYLRHKPALGIPALYYADHIDSSGEPFTADDYTLVRTTWAHYRASLALQGIRTRHFEQSMNMIRNQELSARSDLEVA